MDNIMIGIPIKKAGLWVSDWWDKLCKLTYPKDNLRLVFIYSESSDNTLDLLKSFKQSGIFKNFEVYHEQYNDELRIGGIQLGASIYKDFQKLIKREDFFMLMDCDLIDFPPDLIEKLLEVDAEVVAPYPYCESGFFYDTWVFRINNIRFSRDDPPAKDSTRPILVDSVGTCFIVDSGFFKFANITNPYPNITLCNSIRNSGGVVTACAYIKVYHKDLEKMGILHYPLPPEFGLYPKNGFVDSKYNVIYWDKKRW